MKIKLLIILIISLITSCTSSNKILEPKKQEKIDTDQYETTESNSENFLVKTKRKNGKVFSISLIDPETNEMVKYLLFHNDGITVAQEYHKKDGKNLFVITYKPNGTFLHAILREKDGSKTIHKNYDEFIRKLK